MKAMKQHQQLRQEILSGTSNTIVVMRMTTKMMISIMIILLCPNNNNEGVSALLQHRLVHHLPTSKKHISRSRSSSYNSIPACIRERQPTTTSMLMTTSDKNAAAATAAAATTTTADVNNNNKNNDTDNDDKTKKKQNKTKKKQNKTKKTQKGDDDGKENGIFTKSFYKEFNELLKYRRDVRRFYTNDRKPVSEKLIYQLLNTAFTTSPSVGLSEPWKILHVKSQIAKTNVINNFEKCNQDALQGYNSSNNDEGGSSTTTTNSKAELYSKLKLSGLQDAPIHIAIYCNDATTKGSGLGIQTMPEMKQYSCVCGIMSFWLLARSKGIGCGWVSILDPKQLIIDLNLKEDDDWTLIGYLCVGYPNLDDDNDDDIKDNDIKDNYDDDSVVDGTSGIISRSKRSSTPELELYGWKKRRRGGRKQKQKQKEQMLQDSSAADKESVSPVSASASASASASITNGSSSNNNYLDHDFEDSFDDDDDDDDDDDEDDDDEDDDEDDDNDSYDERELPIIIV